MAGDSQLCEEKGAYFSSLHASAASEKVVFEQSSSPAPASSERHQERDEFLSQRAASEQIWILPHVMTSIPITTWLLVFTGSAAAFARYGATTPFRK